jgi:hypothetical protein
MMSRVKSVIWAVVDVAIDATSFGLLWADLQL